MKIYIKYREGHVKCATNGVESMSDFFRIDKGIDYTFYIENNSVVINMNTTNIKHAPDKKQIILDMLQSEFDGLIWFDHTTIRESSGIKKVVYPFN